MRHFPEPNQGRWLGQVVRGYLTYHPVPTNSQAIGAMRWPPPARVHHLHPHQRFIVKDPRWEPSALAAHARVCPGGAQGSPRSYWDGGGPLALAIFCHKLAAH